MANTPYSLLVRLSKTPTEVDWQSFCEIYAPLIRRWLQAHVLQPADADDIVQDVLTVVVIKVIEFRHNGRTGAFRAWLRAIMANQLRSYWRHRLRATDRLSTDQVLANLEDSSSDLAAQWDEEHDRHVVGALLERIRQEFQAHTWHVFWRYTIEGIPAEEVATELGVSTNVVFIARSRVMTRLREEAAGLLDQ